MDHQAFAQILGNYGEFFGAIAVVVTLIYLAGQLRQNTNALRSASYEQLAREIWQKRKRNSPTAFVEYLESCIPELSSASE